MAKETKKSCTFGPVPSQRLGKSLGIDFVPFKTCTYDCIYCQLGRTTVKTTDPIEYTPVEKILGNVEKKLKTILRPDFLTLSGSGEPTLHSRLGDIIRRLKDRTDIPIAVLTNGSLFWHDEVLHSVSEADLVIPSLDGGDEQTFRAVNRPHRAISFEQMAGELVTLREHFTGPLWLEVFLVKGINDSDTHLSTIKAWIDRIAPDRIQLNTAVRTPAEDFVEVVEKETLEAIAAFFGPTCEVIADYTKVHQIGEFRRTRDDVLEMLRRRPCSLDDIAEGLDLHRNEAVKYLEELLDQRLIHKKKAGGQDFLSGGWKSYVK